jgi:hypothetical protein
VLFALVLLKAKPFLKVLTPDQVSACFLHMMLASYLQIPV